MNGKRFPRYLNSPIQLLWFESDEMAVIFSLFGLWVVYFSWLTFGLFIAMPWLYRWMKSKYPRGFFEHAKYHIGIVELRHYPCSFEKEFHE